MSSGQRPIDPTLLAMQEMERYCAAHPKARWRTVTPDSPFVAARLSHYWARVLKRASVASATASRQRYAPLMRSTPARSGRLPIGISTTATSRLPVLPPFDPRAMGRPRNIQPRRSPCAFELVTAEEDSTPLDTHVAQRKSRTEFHAISERPPIPSGTSAPPMRGRGCADWRSIRDQSRFQLRVPQSESCSHPWSSAG